MKFLRASRITKRQDIERVREEGRALRTGEILARLSSSPFPHLRVGIVVPRFGHTAVERNRLKRRLREIVRTELLPADLAGDLVLWARPAAYDASYAGLRLALENVRRRIDKQADQAGDV